ncbi:hypothetical protein [Streptomyces hirsutus]|uniref:hypothetical protein n=1 Tax=Streptomyces hirsutus TaxID=35620 RepID=UPI003649D3AD
MRKAVRAAPGLGAELNDTGRTLPEATRPTSTAARTLPLAVVRPDRAVRETTGE